MKKVLMITTLLVAAMPLLADDNSYLLFEHTDGSTQSVVANGTTITFSDGQAVVVSGDTTLKLSLRELSKMFFSSESTGIESVEDQGQTGNGVVEIYTLNGVRVDKMDRAGVYIIKQNGRTFKQVVK